MQMLCQSVYVSGLMRVEQQSVGVHGRLRWCLVVGAELRRGVVKNRCK